MGPIFNYKCSYSRHGQGRHIEEKDQTHRREKDVKTRRRNECDLATRNVGSHQKVEKVRKDSPLEPLEGAWP